MGCNIDVIRGMILPSVSLWSGKWGGTISHMKLAIESSTSYHIMRLEIGAQSMEV